MAYRPRTRVWSAAALGSGAVSTADMKAHLRVTGSAEDALIAAYSGAATVAVERWTQRLLTVRQAVMRLTDLPDSHCPIELPGGAVSSVTSVVADGVTISGGTVIGDSPALLIPDSDWPTVIGEGYPVVITYQVGYSAIPMDLIHAVKLIAAEMYEQRSNSVMGTVSRVIVSAEYLMTPYRIWAAA
jgi:uncharacterized phiE125 gp8 family phage protein